MLVFIWIESQVLPLTSVLQGDRKVEVSSKVTSFWQEGLEKSGPSTKILSSYHVQLLKYCHFHHSQGCWCFPLAASLFMSYAHFLLSDIISLNFNVIYFHGPFSIDKMAIGMFRPSFDIWIPDTNKDSPTLHWEKNKSKYTVKKNKEIADTKWACKVKTDLPQVSDFEKWVMILKKKNIRIVVSKQLPKIRRCGFLHLLWCCFPYATEMWLFASILNNPCMLLCWG